LLFMSIFSRTQVRYVAVNPLTQLVVYFPGEPGSFFFPYRLQCEDMILQMVESLPYKRVDVKKIDGVR
jgi:hypothetical protein